MMHTAVVLWLFSAVISVGRGGHHEGHNTDNTDVESSFSLVTSANKEFAFRLFRKLAGLPESQGKNIFCSPVIVSVALAAVSVGARGETHQQLFNGLGYSNSNLTQTDVNQAFREILSNMAPHQDIDAGTAVFVDNLFKPQPEFLDVLKQSYSAEGSQVDFKKPTDSTNTINKYVADKTNGKIPELVQNLDPNTLMYLISYIYYKGAWKTPFDPELTYQDEFFIDTNNKVPVQMKMEKATVETYRDEETSTSVLHLPFNNSYSMLLLLPDNMATLESVISPALITKWINEMTSSEYNIYVPKFSIKTSYKLKDVLTEMGMSDMFSGRADLSGIIEGQQLSVSELSVRQVRRDLRRLIPPPPGLADDAGEAQLYANKPTGIGMEGLAVVFVPDLKFDHPFMVIITDSVKDVLFLGKIVNPNI